MIKFKNHFFLYVLIFACSLNVYAMEMEQQKQQSLVQVPPKLQRLFDDLSVMLNSETRTDLVMCIKLQREEMRHQKEKGPDYGNQLCTMSYIIRRLDKQIGEQNISWKELVNILSVIKHTDKTRCILTGLVKKYTNRYTYLSMCCQIDGIIDATKIINNWQDYIAIASEEKNQILDVYEKSAVLAIGNPENLAHPDCEVQTFPVDPVKNAFGEAFELLNVPYLDHFTGTGIAITEKKEYPYEELVTRLLAKNLFNLRERK